jgi:hypothetical protein
MKHFFKRVYHRVIRDIYDISFFRQPGELAYQKAFANYVNKLPLISADDLQIIEKLRQEGVCVTSLADLGMPSTTQMLRAAKSLMKKIPRKASGNKNEYFVRASNQQLMENPEIFKWGLQERLLNIVENYLGLPAAYHGSYFRRDLVNNVKVKTRLWHKDIEDPNLVKVIVYLTDVAEDGGTFQYIPKNLSYQVCHKAKYKYGQIPDKIWQKIVNPSDVISCTGVAGTVIFAVTGTVLHRGKIPVIGDRFSIFFDYTSRQPKFPFYCKSVLPDEDLRTLSVSLSPRQRACVFWR